MRKIYCCLFLLFLFVILPFQSSFAQEDKPYQHERLLVKFSKDIPRQVQQNILESNSAKTDFEIPQIGMKAIHVPEAAFEHVENALKNSKAFDYVERDYLFEQASIPNDLYYSKQIGRAHV